MSEMKFPSQNDDEVMSQINITPLTDCMMVLLIIFMIASTAISQTGFGIKLPRVATREENPPSQIVISLAKTGDIYVGANRVGPENLEAYLKKISKARSSRRIVINGDQDVPYSRVILAMDCAKKAGLTSIALATKVME
jgi:biopolymer transport protein TolR